MIFPVRNVTVDTWINLLIAIISNSFLIRLLIENIYRAPP